MGAISRHAEKIEERRYEAERGTLFELILLKSNQTKNATKKEAEK